MNTDGLETNRRTELTETLRQRVVAGLRDGSLQRGERLPSARALARRYGVDPRLVLASYHSLADEALVELRSRSGIFVAASAPAPGTAVRPAELWLVDVLAEGVSRGVPAPSVAEWLRRSVDTLRLRAIVIAGTIDQRDGICRELREDYGLHAFSPADGLLAEPARDAEGHGEAEDPLVAEIAHSDLVVTTAACTKRVVPIATRLGKAHVIASIRPDLVGDEWLTLLRNTVYVVVTDLRFGVLIQRFFEGVPGAGNIRLMVVGRDDMSAIPSGATTYITQSARARLGSESLPGNPLPPTRVFSTASARQLTAFIVRANLAAAEAASAASNGVEVGDRR